MEKSRSFLLWGLAFVVATVALLPLRAHAFGLVLQYQGDVDNRELYFADIGIISNRTPPDQLTGPMEIREIDVTAVYESEKRPEFVHMKLQFQCPAPYSLDAKTGKLNINKNKVRDGDNVTFRIGPGSYQLRRADLKAEDVPVSDWKTSNAAMLSRAGALACNHIEVDQALHQSIKGNQFDFDGFGQRISALGLPADSLLIGPNLPSEFLDFAWGQFWYDKVVAGKRPDPSGKWSRPATAEEKAAAMKKMQQLQAEAAPALEAAKKSLLADIQKSKAAMDSRANVTRPDGKKITPIESNLLTLWKGRPEEDIVRVMGNPEFNQAGDRRYLRYTRYWEKPGVTVYGTQGVVAAEMGGYAECFVEFKTKQNQDGAWLVEDVLVRSDYEGEGLGQTRLLCVELGEQASR